MEWLAVPAVILAAVITLGPFFYLLLKRDWRD